MHVIIHGSYGGYQKCKKRPEGSCDKCKAANTEYTKNYRNGKLSDDRVIELACVRVVQRLIEEVKYSPAIQLLDEELRKLGRGGYTP